MTQTTDAWDDSAWNERRYKVSEWIEMTLDGTPNESQWKKAFKNLFSLAESKRSQEWGMSTIISVTGKELIETGIFDIELSLADNLAMDKKAILKLFAKILSEDQMRELQQSGSCLYVPKSGWHLSLVNAYNSLLLLEECVREKSVDRVAMAAYKYGVDLSQMHMQRQYEEMILKFKNSKNGGVKGNSTISARSKLRAKAAVAELLRRMKSNPHALKTSHIEQMAKEKDGDKLRWGCRKNLMDWCKHIKSPKPKTVQ